MTDITTPPSSRWGHGLECPSNEVPHGTYCLMSGPKTRRSGEFFLTCKKLNKLGYSSPHVKATKVQGHCPDEHYCLPFERRGSARGLWQPAHRTFEPEPAVACIYLPGFVDRGPMRRSPNARPRPQAIPQRPVPRRQVARPTINDLLGASAVALSMQVRGPGGGWYDVRDTHAVNLPIAAVPPHFTLDVPLEDPQEIPLATSSELSTTQQPPSATDSTTASRPLSVTVAELTGPSTSYTPSSFDIDLELHNFDWQTFL